MAQATKLGSAMAGGAAATAPASPSSRLLAALSGRRVLEPIRVPGLDIEATMTLIGSERAVVIESDVVRAMQSLGLQQDVLTIPQYELERARRVLAEAVREAPAPGADPNALPPPLGTATEWGQLAPSIVTACWVMYSDISQKHDPINTPITKDELAEIRDAVEKKSAIRLLSCGARLLVSYLLTTADQPASSATPKSEPGPGSPAD